MAVEIVMTMRISNFSNNLPTTGAANVIQRAAIEKYRANPPLLNPKDSVTGLIKTPYAFMMIPMPAKFSRQPPTMIHHP